jgi:D-3-phosphoglycerate dehydrogenase
VLLVWRERIDESYLRKFPALKAVIRYGIGFERLDLQAGDRMGVCMCNNPEYCTEEVADSALAMILSIQRNILRLNHQARGYASGWQEHAAPATCRTSDATLGLLGAGRIGASVARKARAIGFKVRYFDPYLSESQVRGLLQVGALGVQSVAELVGGCDILSIHTPLDDGTRGLIDRDMISRMKPGASIVNTARGSVIESLDVLCEALRSGQLSQVALDVLPEEPPRSCALFDAWKARESWLEGRLLINPHKAYYSERSAREMRLDAARNALRVLEGAAPKHIVNGVTRQGVVHA